MPYSSVNKVLDLEVRESSQRHLGQLMLSVSNTGSFAEVVDTAFDDRESHFNIPGRSSTPKRKRKLSSKPFVAQEVTVTDAEARKRLRVERMKQSRGQTKKEHSSKMSIMHSELRMVELLRNQGRDTILEKARQ